MEYRYNILTSPFIKIEFSSRSVAAGVMGSYFDSSKLFDIFSIACSILVNLLFSDSTFFASRSTFSINPSRQSDAL